MKLNHEVKKWLEVLFYVDNIFFLQLNQGFD